ncbi:MAG: hypothetical protein ABI162_16670 [Luteolibacter sp.]
MILPATAQQNNGLCGQCAMRARATAQPPPKRTFSGKYDDADWHYGGDFPSDLPNAAGATHIGMFVASCILQGLVGELHAEDFPEELEGLQSREITPGAWLIAACDEKFTDEELNDEGNAFAMDYYYSDGAQYLSDYERTLCRGLKTAYHAQDTWESFDKIDKVIRERFTEWRKRIG